MHVSAPASSKPFSCALTRRHGLKRSAAGPPAACQATPAAAPTEAPVNHRRALLAGCGALMLAPMLPQATQAAVASGQTYYDEKDKFAVDVPEGWTLAVPEEPYDRFRAGVSARRAIAWVSPLGTAVNIVMVIVPAGADYTSLGSYGTANDFGSNLVTSMDRSFTKGARGTKAEDVMTAKLLGTRTNGNTYFVDYTSQRGSEECKFLYSAVALGDNGHHRRFYTITATVPEGKKAELGPVVAAAVNSFRLV